MNKDVKPRYRCFTSRAYTEKSLLDKQSESLEESLWVTVRKLEERKNLLNASAHYLQELNQLDIASEKSEKVKNIDMHIEKLKALTVSLGNTDLENTEHE